MKVEIKKVQCVDFIGRENHILLMHIEPSMEVYANQADEVFMRVGDKSKRLTFEERTQMNVIKDVVFERKILKIVTDAISYMDTQIKEKTYLGKKSL